MTKALSTWCMLLVIWRLGVKKCTQLQLLQDGASQAEQVYRVVKSTTGIGKNLSV